MLTQSFSNVSEPCLLKIRSMYPSLRPSEQKVADYVLSHPDEVVDLSITELGRRAGVSDAAIVRFSQAIGYPGYWGLKIAVARDIAIASKEHAEEIFDDNSTVSVKSKIFRDSMQALSDTESILDLGQVDKAVKAICGSDRLLFLGVGASGLVAMDAQYKFSRIGLKAFSYLDPHVQAATAAILGPRDLALAISHSGDTNVVVTSLKLAKDGGAKTACITNYSGSAVAQIADIVLLTASKETIFRTSATSSRIAQLAVVDTLYTLTLLERQGDSPANLEKARKAVAVLET